MPLRCKERRVLEQAGAVSLEQVVLVTVVALVIVTALAPVGTVLLDYHKNIELVMALPIP